MVRIALEFEGVDGLRHHLPVPNPLRMHSRLASRFPRLARLKVLSRQVWKLLRMLVNGQFKTIWLKIQAALNRKPQGYVSTLDEFRRALHAVETPQKWSLIVDHDLGGGANKYREEQVAKLLRPGTGVIVLTTQINILSDVVIVYLMGQTRRIRVRDKNDVLLWAGELGVETILYNNAVSFADVPSTLEMMVQARHQTHCKLIVAVHDYFMVCPSQHLINAQGRYCGIPEPAECERCLSANKRAYIPVYARHSISEWRRAWSFLLNACDEIRMFSSDSERLFLKVYDDLQLRSKISIVPHAVTMPTHKLFEQLPRAPLNIGIVGNISFEKGSAVIQRLADYIDRERLPVRLTLYGTMDLPVKASCFRDAGPYVAEQLPSLLQQSGVNVCLLPSICPETFSYTSQELMQIGVPLACFDLGAPPERVRQYAYGCVLSAAPEAPAQTIMKELISFHQALYGPEH